MVHTYNLPDLVIANSGTTSNAIAKATFFKYATTISIQAPSALTGTVNAQATLDDTQWFNLGTIAAGAILSFANQGYSQIRVQSGSTELGERTFTVSAVEEIR